MIHARHHHREKYFVVTIFSRVCRRGTEHVIHGPGLSGSRWGVCRWGVAVEIGHSWIRSWKRHRCGHPLNSEGFARLADAISQFEPCATTEPVKTTMLARFVDCLDSKTGAATALRWTLGRKDRQGTRDRPEKATTCRNTEQPGEEVTRTEMRRGRRRRPKTGRTLWQVGDQGGDGVTRAVTAAVPRGPSATS